MQLRFGEIKGGQLQGEIYMALPDEHQSFVAGTFKAEVRDDGP